MDKPYSEDNFNYEDDFNYEEYQNYTRAKNYYSGLGAEFIIFSFIGGAIFYNIYCIFKDKMGNCCLKQQFKHATLRENLVDDCSICLNNLKKEDKVLILKCNHLYHSECLLEWFNKDNNNCPLCREILF